jgi:tetratricopeptide (TPR) repeat protein
MGQSDSVSLSREIERVGRMIEYPEALVEAGKVHQRIMTSGCQGCKVPSLIMMGKMYWVDGRYQSSIDYFRNALADLPGSDTLTIRSIVYTYIGLNFYYQGYYDSALYYHGKSLGVIKAGNNRRRMPRVLNHIALVYHRKGDYKKSLEYMFEMEKILEEFNDRATEVELWGGMENVLIDTLYFRQKIADNQAVLRERTQKNETKDLFTIYHNLGRAHSQLKENLIAARNWKKAAELMENQGLLPYWNDVGTGYGEANRRDSCFFFHYRFKTKCYGRSTRIAQGSALQHLGEAHYRFGNYDSALYYFKLSLRLNAEMNNRITQAALHRRMAETYFELIE